MEGGDGYHLGKDGRVAKYTVDFFVSRRRGMYDKLEERSQIWTIPESPALSTTHLSRYG